MKKMGPLVADGDQGRGADGAPRSLLWLTDFVHHISPAVIGIGVGLFALLPRVGILDIEDMTQAQLHAGVLRRRRGQHGHGAGGDQGRSRC